jgi:hypothetical protein
MISNLLNRFRQNRALAEWRRSAIGGALERHTVSHFQQASVLKHFDQDSKTQLINQFYARVVAVAQDENPFLRCRQEIAEAALMYTTFQVICLKPDEKDEAFLRQ